MWADPQIFKRHWMLRVHLSLYIWCTLSDTCNRFHWNMYMVSDVYIDISVFLFENCYSVMSACTQIYIHCQIDQCIHGFPPCQWCGWPFKHPFMPGCLHLCLNCLNVNICQYFFSINLTWKHGWLCDTVTRAHTSEVDMSQSVGHVMRIDQLESINQVPSPKCRLVAKDLQHSITLPLDCTLTDYCSSVSWWSVHLYHCLTLACLP